MVTENIQSRIYTVRGVQVMLDEDLAALYHVETRVLNQAVKRNKDRFPEQFWFQLSTEEYERLRSQIVTLENDEEFPNRKSHIVMYDEDSGITKCDTFKTLYHLGASLKDLGKKWFAFPEMDGERTCSTQTKKECTKTQEFCSHSGLNAQVLCRQSMGQRLKRYGWK